ncbi:MAG: hypothetical protein ACR2MN_05790 [Acidimicrobiales bacterium]
MIRVAPAVEVNEPERRFRGYHRALWDCPDTSAGRVAIDRYWTIREPPITSLVVYTLASFIVVTGRLQDAQQNDNRQWTLKFDIDDPEAVALRGHRLATGGGGTIALVPAKRR